MCKLFIFQTIFLPISYSRLTSKLSSANDLTLELQSCKRRVDQLSDFTRRLTERHANLQAEHLVTLSSLEETKNLLIEKGDEIVQLNEKHESERKESEGKMNTLQCELNDLSVKVFVCILYYVSLVVFKSITIQM